MISKRLTILSYGTDVFVRALFLLLFTFLACSCNDYAPKPIGYNRIDHVDYPYKTLDARYFQFQLSGQVYIDTLRAPDNAAVWFNIVYPDYGARIHCSYFHVTKQSIKEALDDSYQLAFSHSIKANGINQILYKNDENRTYGIMYDIEGNVATPIQFFLTDSISNFFRASFYYDTKVRSDSVSPITDFVRDDIVRLMETFKWK